jgi:hypothetical protein
MRQLVVSRYALPRPNIPPSAIPPAVFIATCALYRSRTSINPQSLFGRNDTNGHSNLEGRQQIPLHCRLDFTCLARRSAAPICAAEQAVARDMWQRKWFGASEGSASLCSE